MSDQDAQKARKRGRKPELFKIDAPFEDALETALKAPAPPADKARQSKKRKKRK